jgi:hypothetical protein
MTVCLTHGWQPKVGDREVLKKMDYLRQKGDEFDVLFVGTSRVHHQVIPALFDRLMTEGGVPVHSFNLGVDGMRTPEDNYLLETALASRTRPLRWIILECKDINFREQDVDQQTARAVSWHDSTRLNILAQRLWWGNLESQRTFQKRLRGMRDDVEVFSSHFALWLQNETGIGCLAEKTADWLKQSSSSFTPVAPLESRFDGYDSAGKATPNPAERITYVRKFALLQRRKAESDYKDRASQLLLRRQQELAARHGAKLILLIPPTLVSSKFIPDPSLLPVPEVFDCDRPDLFPELFALENRRDETHLNESGAEILTALLAKRLLAAIPLSNR